MLSAGVHGQSFRKLLCPELFDFLRPRAGTVAVKLSVKNAQRFHYRVARGFREPKWSLARQLPPRRNTPFRRLAPFGFVHASKGETCRPTCENARRASIPLIRPRA